jgi:hypothetical protein
MVRITILLLTLFIMPSFVGAENASVNLKIDNADLFIGDAIIIDIESTGLVEPLDVEPLKRIAQFDRETYGTRIAVVNQKVVEIKIRRMEFTATKAGPLIFGPLIGIANTGDVVSNAISVVITKPSEQQWSPGNNELSLDFSVDNTQPYIHQQFVANLTLKHRFAIADESMVLPDFAEFDVVPVLVARRTFDPDDGSWRLIRWQWLLHPKQSGNVTLPGPSWKGLMIKSRTQRSQFAIAAPDIDLRIGSAINANEWWLPASNLTLSDSWSKPVIELSAGDEVIRTITVIAQGALSQQIPDITPLPSRAISAVLISKNREQSLINDKIVSKAEFQFRMTAQSPIPVFLDTVRVPWWNTVERKMSEAIIPARRINIGLPERADVLASLALRGSFWERSLLRLKSINMGWAIPAMLLMLIATVIAFSKRSEYLTSLQQRTVLRNRVRKINKAVRSRNWITAWAQLENAPAALRHNPDYHALKSICESNVFGGDHAKTVESQPPVLTNNVEQPSVSTPPMVNI